MTRVSLDNKNCWEVGFTGTYIQDHPFKYLLSIHPEVAVVWIKKDFPDVNMGNKIAKDLEIEITKDGRYIINGWLNKLFILVDYKYGKWLAISNHDGQFAIYMEK